MPPNRLELGSVATRVVAVLVVIAAIVGVVLFVGGKAGVGPLANGDPGGLFGFVHRGPPDECPLLGLEPGETGDPGLKKRGAVPNRPALAVKVENLPAARPQTGLSWADIVYEEPVEVFITRFIAVYQCRDASRIEPVRSARLTDPDILRQFGHPLFAYAGAVPPVVQKVAKAKLIDVNFRRQEKAYHRDESREAPHNLYTSTQELYASTKWPFGTPEPVFSYSPDVPDGKRVSEIHLPFSDYSDVYWRWNARRGVWLRWHGDVPHTLSDGSQVSAKNVVVQVVKVIMTHIHDVKGAPSPEVISTGSGKAYVFRNGRVISGSWSRSSLTSRTIFKDTGGDEIAFSPGNTWVELFPSTLHPSFH